MIDLPHHELQHQQAEICRRVNRDRWNEKFQPLPSPIPSTHRQGLPMRDSIETSEAEAKPYEAKPASPSLPGDPVADARFAVANPDILHTPQQMRDIMAGLLRKIDCSSPNCQCGADCKAGA